MSIRDTQDSVESLSTETTKTRVTSDSVETLSTETNKTRVTSDSVEVLKTESIKARITADVVEVLKKETTKTRITVSVVEVLETNVSSFSTGNLDISLDLTGEFTRFMMGKLDVNLDLQGSLTFGIPPAGFFGPGSLDLSMDLSAAFLMSSIDARCNLAFDLNGPGFPNLLIGNLDLSIDLPAIAPLVGTSEGCLTDDNPLPGNSIKRNRWLT